MKILAAGSCPDNSAALQFDNCNRWRETLPHLSPQRPLACSNYFVQLSVSFLFLSLEMRFESLSDSKINCVTVRYCNARATGTKRVASDLRSQIYSWRSNEGKVCPDSLVGKCRPDFGTPVAALAQPRPATAATIISASAITPRPQVRPRDSPGLSFRRALPRFVAKGPDQFQTDRKSVV